MKFEDDKPIVCDQCGQTISAGDDYYRWNEHNLCSEDCVKDSRNQNQFVDITKMVGGR